MPRDNSIKKVLVIGSGGSSSGRQRSLTMQEPRRAVL